MVNLLPQNGKVPREMPAQADQEIPGACHATVFALSLPSSVYMLAMGSAQENRQAVRLLVYDSGIARDRSFGLTPDTNVWPWNVPFAATDSVPDILSCDTCHMTSLGVCRASQRRVVSNRPLRTKFGVANSRLRALPARISEI